MPAQLPVAFTPVVCCCRELLVPGSSSLGLVGDANLNLQPGEPLKELNRRLSEHAARSLIVCFFDVDQVAAQYGRLHWTDPRMFFASRLPLSPGAFSSVCAGAIANSIDSISRITQRCLCTDLDNTLWGGILAKDGPDADCDRRCIFRGIAFWSISAILSGLRRVVFCWQSSQRTTKRMSRRPFNFGSQTWRLA